MNKCLKNENTKQFKSHKNIEMHRFKLLNCTSNNITRVEHFQMKKIKKAQKSSIFLKLKK